MASNYGEALLNLILGVQFFKTSVCSFQVFIYHFEFTSLDEIRLVHEIFKAINVLK